MTYRARLNDMWNTLRLSWVSGVVQHYDKMNPNPWYQELDALEVMILDGNEIQIKEQVAVCEKNLLTLIQQYKSGRL